MMKAPPAPAFIMSETYFLLEILVIALYPPAKLDQIVIAHPLRVLDKGNNSIDAGIAG
jgi:hypothetical protein